MTDELPCKLSPIQTFLNCVMNALSPHFLEVQIVRSCQPSVQAPGSGGGLLFSGAVPVE
jgi:hypothetical protein